jgi:Leucine-rich repeat (LRR) protein
MVSRLYRHAIESILSFASLQELAALLCVNHEWRAAVNSMAPCSFEMSCTNDVTQLPLMCASPIARHITCLYVFEHACTSKLLELMQLRMPRLAKLGVYLVGDEKLQPHIFPVHLTELCVSILHYTKCGEAQSVIDAIAQLPWLEKLSLEPHDDEWRLVRCNISFAPLAQLPRLYSLCIYDMIVSKENARELRSLYGLRELQCRYVGDNLTPGTLLASPHKLSITTLGWTSLGTDEDDAGLSTLIDMVQLNLYDNRLGHADFLQCMPQLTDLNMQFSTGRPTDALRIVTSLKSCTMMKTLALLHGAFCPTSAHLTSFLSCMPMLTELGVDVSSLTSLAWLSAGALPQTLIILTLSGNDRNMPFSEMHHLHALRNLKTLGIDNQLTVHNRHDPSFQPYKVPSTLIPSLRTLFFHNCSL